MNQEELLERLAYFFDPANAVGAVLYFVLEQDGQPIIRLADIDAEIQTELKDRFLRTIRERFIENEELSVMAISAADERKNVVYNYDLVDRPNGLNILDEILANQQQPIFSFNEQNLADVKGFLITIGNATNKIALYKKQYPVNLLRQDRFIIFKENERIAKVPGDVITIDKNFDFMMVEEELFILNLTTLERHFGFEDVIRDQAQQVLDLITGGELLENVAAIEELALNLTNARKLMKLRNSPVLSLPVNSVIEFISQHPGLSTKLKFNEDRTRISLDTAISKKHFLKLLNDDYLFSQLTALHYDSLAKDRFINPPADTLLT